MNEYHLHIVIDESVLTDENVKQLHKLLNDGYAIIDVFSYQITKYYLLRKPEIKLVEEKQLES